MVIGEYFLSLFFQLLFTAGAVALFGFLIYLVNRTFYRLVGAGRAVCYATGIIGTPIHEASHALMCLVFGHRIEEIKFFSPDPESGTLGYVRHSYNRRSFRQNLGNFFIGIAPVVTGGGVILLLLMLLASGAREGVLSAIGGITEAESIGGKAGAAVVAAGKSFLAIFAPVNFTDGWWYLFMALALCISLHVNLSPADVKGSLSGALAFVALFAVLDIVLAVIDAASGSGLLSVVTGGVVTGGAVLMSVMALSLGLSLVLLVVAAVVRLIVRTVRRA